MLESGEIHGETVSWRDLYLMYISSITDVRPRKGFSHLRKLSSNNPLVDFWKFLETSCYYWHIWEEFLKIQWKVSVAAVIINPSEQPSFDAKKIHNSLRSSSLEQALALTCRETFHVPRSFALNIYKNYTKSVPKKLVAMLEKCFLKIIPVWKKL